MVDDSSREYSETNDEWRASMQDKPMLLRLHEDRVFSIGAVKSGKFLLLEECDEYFGSLLTSEEVIQLANELIAVAQRETDHE